MAKKKATRKKTVQKKSASRQTRQIASASSGLNDRIRELRRVKGAELVPHPGNWREHGDSQLAALDGILAEVGIADAVLAFPADGKGADGDFTQLMLFDGHARASRDPDQEWPVLVTDLTREEADKMILAIDPIGGMADTNTAALRKMMAGVEIQNTGLVSLFEQLKQMSKGEMPPPANDPDKHWGEMPEYEHEDKTAFRTLHLHFADAEAIQKFAELIGQPITEKTRSLWYPPAEIETYADKRYSQGGDKDG